MPKEPKHPNHLRAWRLYRGLTQSALGELIGTTGSVISLLETSDRRLSDKWLRKLSPALRIPPGLILERDPDELSTSVLEIWADIPEEKKAQALRVLEAFRKTV